MSGLPHWLSCLPPSQQLEASLPPGQSYSWCHTGCWVLLPKNQRLPLAGIQFSNTQTVKGQQPTAAECGGFQGEVKGKKAQRLLRDPALSTDEDCRRQQGPEESPPKWGDFVNRGRAGNGWPCRGGDSKSEGGLAFVSFFSPSQGLSLQAHLSLCQGTIPAHNYPDSQSW